MEKRRLELKAARVRKGWTQLHLAIIMSVSQQTVAKWEQGRNTPGTFKQLRRLESVLGVPMEVLFPDIFAQGGVETESGSFNGGGSGGVAENKPVVGL